MYLATVKLGPDDVGQRPCRYLCVKVFKDVCLWDGLERNGPFGMRFGERRERRLKGLEFLGREADLKAQCDWGSVRCGRYANQQGDQGQGRAYGSFELWVAPSREATRLQALAPRRDVAAKVTEAG
jgi:hypothetical protein